MLKKSKGLKSRLIEMDKFDISKFEVSLAKEASMIIPKVFKSIRKAKMDYNKELKQSPSQNKNAPKEFWDDIIEKVLNLGIDLIGFAPVDENFMFEKDYVGGLELLYKNGIVLFIATKIVEKSGHYLN